LRGGLARRPECLQIKPKKAIPGSLSAGAARSPLQVAGSVRPEPEEQFELDRIEFHEHELMAFVDPSTRA
jgi:hypothetical protein